MLFSFLKKKHLAQQEMWLHVNSMETKIFYHVVTCMLIFIYHCNPQEQTDLFCGFWIAYIYIYDAL